MKKEESLQRLVREFEPVIIESHCNLGEETLVLSPSGLRQVALTLRDDPNLDFQTLMDLTAVDHFDRQPRFELVYHLWSLSRSARLRLKVPVDGIEPQLDSVCHIWPVANWYEREVYDMFGIRFRGHPDLRRLLLYPEFEGHPLRKDYPIDKRQPLVGPQD